MKKSTPFLNSHRCTWLYVSMLIACTGVIIVLLIGALHNETILSNPATAIPLLGTGIALPLLVAMNFAFWRTAAKDREELEQIIGSIAPDVLVLIGPDRTILACTDTVREMFGYDPQEVIGEKSDRLYFDRRKENTPGEIYRALEEQGFHVGEARGRHSNGNVFPLELITSERRGQPGAVILIRNISDRKKMEESIRKARRYEAEVAGNIQKRLLIGRHPRHINRLDIATFNQPSREVDGDFFEFIHFKDTCLDMVIGDVMGKGTAAALLGAATKGELLRITSKLMSTGKTLPAPREIVTSLHAATAREFIELESFVTLCYARFDTESMHMCYVDCGHTETLHYTVETGDCTTFCGKNMPLGFSLREKYVENEIPLNTDDIFVFYSDGITEARNQSGEFYGITRLKKVVRVNAHHHAGKIRQAILDDLSDFLKTSLPNDDLTGTIIKITPQEADQAKQQSGQIRIPAELTQLQTLRKAVREFWDEFGPDEANEESGNLLALAVNEAAANVIHHACHDDASKSIEMLLTATPDRIRIDLVHNGDAFVSSKVNRPSTDGDQDCGYGLFLIEQATDAFDHYQREDGLNGVMLMKKIKGENDDDPN